MQMQMHIQRVCERVRCHYSLQPNEYFPAANVLRKNEEMHLDFDPLSQTGGIGFIAVLEFGRFTVLLDRVWQGSKTVEIAIFRFAGLT